MYYEELKRFERDGLTIVVDKREEDFSPRGWFEDCDVDEIIAKIDNGTYDWFTLRVRVLLEHYELASAFLGGCCYEDARKVLTDGTADDMIVEALKEAHVELGHMAAISTELVARQKANELVDA